MSGITNWSEFLTTIMNMLIIPILPVVTAYLIAFIKKKTSEINNSVSNMELSKYIEMAENAVLTAVTSVSQVYVDAIKKSNGSLSSYEQKIAFEMAKEKVLKILGDLAVDVLKNHYKDFDTWLENRIEYYVSLQKPQQASNNNLENGGSADESDN